MSAETAPAEPRPAAPTRYYGIQILRGLAALLVVLHHEAQNALDLFRSTSPAFLFRSTTLAFLIHGAAGVDIFFPISGFVLYLTASSVLRQPATAGAWRDFAWRRFVRVAPMYWFFTTLKLLLFFAIPATMLHYQFRLWNAAAAYLFLPAVNNLGQPEPPLVVGWTLAYEMLFYVIVTAAIAWRAPLLRFCAVLLVALSLLGLVIPRHWGGLTYLADPIELEFLAGMLLAASAQRLRRLPVYIPLLLSVAALALLSASPIVFVEFMPRRVLVWGIPGILLVLSAIALEPHFAFSRRRFLLLLGDASFSLYLTHTFIVPAVRVLFTRLDLQATLGLSLFFATGLALCLAVAIPFHLYVELPALNWLSKRGVPFSLRSAETP